MQLFLAPLIPETYAQIVSLHELYELTPPPVPEEALIVTNEHLEVVAAVCLYEAKPFLLAEFAIANPRAGRRVVHQATELLIDAYVARSAMSGLIPMAPLRSKGLMKVLAKKGFVNTGCPMWTNRMPMVPVTTDRPDPRLPPPPQDIVSSVADDCGSEGPDETKVAAPKKTVKKKRKRKARKSEKSTVD